MLPSPSPAPSSFDELTTEVVEAVKTMTPVQKANLLLNTSLAMIDAGQCVDNLFFTSLSCRVRGEGMLD